MTSIETDDQAYEFFIQESSELLQKLEMGLMNLSQDHDLEKLHALMRAAHSIKGGAACVGLTGIGQIAHDLENGIRALYADDMTFDVELEELLLQAYDCLRSPLQQQIETGNCDQEAAIDRSQPIFQQLEEKLGCPLEEAAELPEVPMETDMTVFLFEEEIPSGLRRWESLLAHLEQPNTLAELKTQAEVFATLGNMLSLSGFNAIAETTLKAFEVNAEIYPKIAQVALADFWAGHAAVMGGDRVEGGAPSLELVQLSQPQTPQPQAEPIQTPPQGTREPQAKPRQTVLPSTPPPAEALPETAPMSSVESPEPSPQKPATKPVQSTPQTALGLRVDVERFDTINQLVGELATQDNSFVLQNQKKRQALATLEKTWKSFQRFLNLVQEFTEYSDSSHPKTQSQFNEQAAFNQLLQGTVEEMNEAGDLIYEMKLQNLQDQQLFKNRQQTLKQVQKHLTETRMLPLESLLNRFPRMIRDLCLRYEKNVDLDLMGQNTLVDKAILEKLYDPLVHLIRNAFDHGIESKKERQKAGKEEPGRIEIKAYNKGNNTYLEVKDNGRGINPENIRQKIVKNKIISGQDAARLSVGQLYEFLFHSGFSTKDKVSDLSGRGVGLVAVKNQIESLKGTLNLQSEPGKGTTFIIRLPWKLTLTKLLIFRIQQNLFAIPMDTLTAILSVTSNEIQSNGNRHFYDWHGQKIPLIQSLLNQYNYSGILPPVQQQTHSLWEGDVATQFSGKIMLLVISQGLESIALKIDQVVMEQQLTIKPFGKALTAPSYLYGCTLLGDGRLVPVVDSSELLEHWQQQKYSSTSQLMVFPTQIQEESQQLSTVLIIDDSLTTRQSLSTTLKQSGYRVLQAKNGLEGLQQLQKHSNIQVVICDLEMPKMNGFEFLSRCRRKFNMEELPVLMLTSRKSERYRRLAKQLGSNGYLTKPWLKKELMKIIETCTV